MIGEEQRLEGTFILPGSSEETTFHSLRRVDPLTGLAARITGKRPGEAYTAERSAPDLESIASFTARRCPFCGDGPITRTPRFSDSLVPGGRITRGDAVLFPNLVPYGSYSAVTTFSRTHHVPLGDFTEVDYRNAMGNCLELCDRVSEQDPGNRWMIISQNVLPPSGGAIFHPHLQLNIDRHPMGWPALFQARLQEEGDDLVPAVVAHAEEGGRVFQRIGSWTWFTPFAPLGQWEIQAASSIRGTWRDLSGEALSDFIRGLLRLHRWLGDRGKNSANMALFLSGDPDRPLHLLMRFMLRSTYREWYRSDQSCYEVALGEAVTDMPPEVLAETLRDGMEAS